MADNFATDANGKAASVTWASDAIGTTPEVHYPRTKISIGADGAASDVHSGNPMPVRLSDGTDPVPLPTALGAGGGLKVDGSGTALPVSLASAPTTPVTGTFWQATQPVSLASAPTTPVTGTFWPATQPVSAPVDAPAFTRLSDGAAAIPLPAALGTGGGLKVDGSGTALPVSMGTLPDTSGGDLANMASDINSLLTAMSSDATQDADARDTGPQLFGAYVGDAADVATLPSTVATGHAVRMWTDAVGRLIAPLVCDAILAGSQALTPKFAKANVAASQTDSVLVAGVAGKRLRVLLFRLHTGATATDVTFNTKPAGAGTAISETFHCGINSGHHGAFAPVGHFETARGEGLSVTTGAGSTTGIGVTYIEVPTAS